MQRVYSRYAEGVMEAAWLAAVALIPVFFNPYSSRIFEPDKIVLLRSLALLMVAAWLIKWTLTRKSLQLDDFRDWRAWLKVPLVSTVLVFLIIILLATITSVNPLASFWGSYQRLQGAYTTAAYLSIFGTLLCNLRRMEQVQRLLTAIIISSLPVVLYAILQRFQLEPIPWGRDVTMRVSANLGNSIFMAAYLIMVIPITAGRIFLAFRSIAMRNDFNIPLMIQATLYVVILILQVISLYLSGSRGPALGFLVSGFILVFVLAIYSHKRWLINSLVLLTLIGILFLALFNTQGGVFASLREHPAIGRFGQLLDPSSNTALVRKYIWQGAAELVAPHAPLQYPDGSEDRWNNLRLLVGYGPESMFVAYNPFYPPELAYVEKRNATPDRSHNETWDTLVTTGLLGLGVYLVLLSEIFYYGLRWLNLLPSRRWTRVFWVIYTVSSIIWAISLSLLVGIEYIGVGLPIGMLMGVVVYMLLIAVAGKIQSPGSDNEWLQTVLILALFAALMAHFVEINFGIAVTATRTYFWVYAALLALIGHGIVSNNSEKNEIINVVLQKNQRETDSSKTRRGAIKTKRHPVSFRLTETWTSAWWGALMLAFLFPALGFIFLKAPGGADVNLNDIWRSLTRLQDNPSGGSWGLVTLLLITAVVSVLLIGTHETGKDPRKPWWQIAMISLMLAALPILFFWLIHAQALLVISSTQPQTLEDLLAQVERFLALHRSFFYFMIALVLVFPLHEWVNERRADLLHPLPALGSLFTLGVAIFLAVITNVSLIQADIAFKLAEQFSATKAWQIAIPIYQRAHELAPDEDYYALFLGRAFLEHGRIQENVKQRDEMLQYAQDYLLEAQRLNPLNLDNTANLARFYYFWASLAGDSCLELNRAELSDQNYAIATRLNPSQARLWCEWSLLYREIFNNIARSQELLDEAIRVDSRYDWSYALYGDIYLRLALQKQGNEGARDLETAADYYLLALERVDEDNLQNEISYRLVLADIYQQKGQPVDALNVLLAASSDNKLADAWIIEEKMAHLYKQVGDLYQARQHATLATTLAPQDQQSRLQAWLDELEITP